jgi:mannose-6-phosphate isomerase-like protein (cupin superfamily)
VPTDRPAINVLLRSEDSAGHISVMANVVKGDFAGPPLHHHDFDETFYIIEGELTFQLGDEIFTRGAGELAFAPRNIPHTYANRSGAPARLILICTPAGFERYFDKLHAQFTGTEPPATAAGPIPETTVVGPRIGDRQTQPTGSES